MRFLTATVGTMLLAGAGLTALPAAAAELVTNGNFEAGNTGFTSTYNFGVTSAPGGYYIFSPGDHTTGNGNYLLADPNGGTDYFWSETFAVQAASNYAFSAFVRSNSTSNEPIFQVRANGTTIAGLGAVGPDNYVQVTGNYNSGAATSVTLRLYNLNPEYSFNDLRVDDVSFTGPAVTGGPVNGAVPEPTTWAMMIAGFGLVGGTLRRRRTALRLATA